MKQLYQGKQKLHKAGNAYSMYAFFGEKKLIAKNKNKRQRRCALKITNLRTTAN